MAPYPLPQSLKGEHHLSAGADTGRMPVLPERGIVKFQSRWTNNLITSHILKIIPEGEKVTCNLWTSN